MSNKLRIAEVRELIEKRHIRGLTRAISIIEINEEGAEELLNDCSFKRMIILSLGKATSVCL